MRYCVQKECNLPFPQGSGDFGCDWKIEIIVPLNNWFLMIMEYNQLIARDFATSVSNPPRLQDVKINKSTRHQDVDYRAIKTCRVMSSWQTIESSWWGAISCRRDVNVYFSKKHSISSSTPAFGTFFYFPKWNTWQPPLLDAESKSKLSPREIRGLLGRRPTLDKRVLTRMALLGLTHMTLGLWKL